MGNTVKMRKGETFADIFDSPETIAQAKKDGYHVCDGAEKRQAEPEAAMPEPEQAEPRRGRPPKEA